MKEVFFAWNSSSQRLRFVRDDPSCVSYVWRLAESWKSPSWADVAVHSLGAVRVPRLLVRSSRGWLESTWRRKWPYDCLLSIQVGVWSIGHVHWMCQRAFHSPPLAYRIFFGQLFADYLWDPHCRRLIPWPFIIDRLMFYQGVAFILTNGSTNTASSTTPPPHLLLFRMLGLLPLPKV